MFPPPVFPQGVGKATPGLFSGEELHGYIDELFRFFIYLFILFYYFLLLFFQSMLIDYAGFFFVPLTSRLVNDDSAGCRKLTALAIKSLLEKVSKRKKIASWQIFLQRSVIMCIVEM